MNRIFIPILLFIILSGQSTYNNIEMKIRNAQHHLYNAHYELAQQEFKSTYFDFPNHPAGPFFLALTNLWQLGFVPDKSSLIDSALSNLRITYSRADSILNLSNQNSEMFFWRGISAGLSAVCQILSNTAPDKRHPSIFNSFITKLKMYSQIRTMKNDLEHSVELDSGLIDSYLGLALYELYGKNNKEEGMKQLWWVIDKGKFFKVEASYLLIDYLYGQGTDEDLLFQAIPTNLGLQMEYPNNLLFQLALGKLYYETENLDEAKSIFVQILNDTTKTYYSFIIDETRYFLGTIAFKEEDHESAIEFYKHILEAKPIIPSYLLPWSYFRSAQCHLQLSNDSTACILLQQTLNSDNINNVHDQAKQLLDSLTKK